MPWCFADLLWLMTAAESRSTIIPYPMLFFKKEMGWLFANKEVKADLWWANGPKVCVIGSRYLYLWLECFPHTSPCDFLKSDFLEFLLFVCLLFFVFLFDPQGSLLRWLVRPLIWHLCRPAVVAIKIWIRRHRRLVRLRPLYCLTVEERAMAWSMANRSRNSIRCFSSSRSTRKARARPKSKDWKISVGTIILFAENLSSCTCV